MDKQIQEILGRDIAGIFEHMKIAERVIARKQKEHPSKVAIISDAFKYLAGNEHFTGKASRLYEAHCEEIIERVITGLNLSPGTDAEIASVLSELSLQAPLNSDHAYVYQTMFKKVFGEVFTEDVPLISESYSGRSKEIVSRLRKKLSRERDCHK